MKFKKFGLGIILFFFIAPSIIIPIPNESIQLNQSDIAIGAEHFLKGHAYALLAFSIFEHRPFDRESFNSYLTQAKEELELSKKHYVNVYNNVPKIPSLLEMQNRFKSFDYNSLPELSELSNKAILNEVIELFRSANIAAIHKRTIDNIENIVNSLVTVLTQEKIEIQTMWKLFEELNNAEQFGNYATQIAYKINNKNKDLRRLK